MVTDTSKLFLDRGQGETTFQASGEFWVWKATGEMTDGKYDQVELITLPQAGPPEHTHIQDELFYFLEGTHRIKIADRLFTATPGAFVRIPAGVSHTWRNIGKDAGKILLTYVPGGLRGFLEKMKPLYLAPELDIPAIAALGSEYGVVVTGPPLTD